MKGNTVTTTRGVKCLTKIQAQGTSKKHFIILGMNSVVCPILCHDQGSWN